MADSGVMLWFCPVANDPAQAGRAHGVRFGTEAPPAIHCTAWLGVSGARSLMKLCVAVGTMVPVGAARKILLTDRTRPVANGEDHETTAAEQPEKHYERQTSALTKMTVHERTHDNPNETPHRKRAPHHSSAMPNQSALFWCALVHDDAHA